MMYILVDKVKKNLHVLFYFSYKCGKRAYLKIHSTSKRVKLDTHNALNKTLAKIQYENSLIPSDFFFVSKIFKNYDLEILKALMALCIFHNDFLFL